MPITREDIIKGYREILASPPPDEATMLNLVLAYAGPATFRRRLRESAECQMIMHVLGTFDAHQTH